MNLKHCTLALGLLAVASFAPARAAVTITEGTEEVTTTGVTETIPVYYLENQWLKLVIVRGPVSHPSTTANLDSAVGQVLYLYKKTGTSQGVSQLNTLQGWTATGGPSVSNTRSYITGRNRMNSQDQMPGSQTVSSAVEADGSVGTITVNMKSNYAPAGTTEKIGIQAIYRLRDNAKWYETEMTWSNPSSTDYSGSGGSAPTSYYYVVPGGSGGTAAPGDLTFAKTAKGLGAYNLSLWWGNTGSTPNGGALTEGWLTWLDPDADVALTSTWDLAAQQAASPTGTLSRSGWFSNRVTMEHYWNNIPANGSLNYVQNLIVDDEIKSVSYAKEGQIIAGIELDKAFLEHYVIGEPMTATIQLNSLDPAAAQTYSVRNLRLEATDEFGSQPSLTLPDVSNVNIPSNEHSATPRTFNLTDPALEAGKQYIIKGELYKGSDPNPITTLMSRAFFAEAPGTRVYLYEDASTGAWILENEVYWVRISNAGGSKAQVTHFVPKNANNRNQTITSSPPHPLFRDYIAPENAAAAFNYGTNVPNVVVDTPTRKAIEFAANAPGGQGGQLTKTYALDSMSGALEVGYKFVNGATPLQGGGIYSDLEMAPGGTGGPNDTFFAHTAEGLFSYHPEEVLAFERKFLGEKWDPANPAIGIPGDFPELDQGWMGVVDIGTVSDATILAWDLPTQKNFALPLGEGGPKVTMNSFGIGAGYERTTIEARFTNIPAGATLDTKYYLIGDTGYKAVSYVEVGRVMAGIWPSAASTGAGAFDVPMTITNIGTTARTFDVKNIRVISGTTETVVGTDQMGIALQPATRDSRTLSVNLAGLAEGSYRVLADLYEGATLVATLESLAFTVGGVVVPPGDVDNDGDVDLDDARLALSIWGGLAAADAGNVTRGDLDPATAGITLEDVVAIVDKATP